MAESKNPFPNSCQSYLRAYILMPFLIKPAFLNNSQVKQHGFWLVFITKIYAFNNNKKIHHNSLKSCIAQLYGRDWELPTTCSIISDTVNSQFPVREKLEQCNPLMIPYTHSQVIKQNVIHPVWKYLRFPEICFLLQHNYFISIVRELCK